MPETAEKSFPLARWIHRQRRRGARHVALHECVFGLSFWRYLMFRSRFALAVMAVRLVVHALEFLLAALTLPALVVPFMLARLAGSAVEGLWWGMSDIMRSRIRSFFHQREMPLLQRELAGWMSLSLLAALGVGGSGMALAMGMVGAFGPLAGAVMGVVALQTALRVVGRTYFSGAYAIRRVFVPLRMTMVADLVLMALGWAAHPWLRQWTVPVCMALSAGVSLWIGYRYARHSMAFLRMSPVRLWSPPDLKALLEAVSVRQMALPALSMMLIRLHPFALTALAQGVLAAETPHRLALYMFYLAMPLLRGALHWGQLMYFDLSRAHLDIFRGFRRALERHALWFSCVYSALLALLAWLGGRLFAGADAGDALPALAAYLLLAGVYGFVQMALFSCRMHRSIIVLALAHSGLLALMLLEKAPTGYWPLSVAVALAASLVLFFKPRHVPEEGVLPYLSWIEELARRKDPGNLLCLRVSSRLTTPAIQAIARSWLRRDGGLVSVCAYRNHILVSGLESMPAAAQMLACSKGQLEQYSWLEGAGGLDVLAKAGKAGWLAPTPAPLRASAELEAEFARLFPGGYVLFPLRPNAAFIQATDGDLRFRILQDARLCVEVGHKKRARYYQARGWHVFARYEHPFICELFVVPPGCGTVERIAYWRGVVDGCNAGGWRQV